MQDPKKHFKPDTRHSKFEFELTPKQNFTRGSAVLKAYRDGEEFFLRGTKDICSDKDLPFGAFIKIFYGPSGDSINFRKGGMISGRAQQ